ncbi:TIGR02206 family membrane protein [Clostridium sp. WILCCON 0269]|uniref:TIGR02206 family membrane protein n=1 Tax=Candidatus Clostridium eludens TaxID=3381663 RepID=A0ABW8SR64_9CLOT
MNKYLTSNFIGGPFVLFSWPHLIALAIILLITILTYVFRHRLRLLKKSTRMYISSFLILQQLSLTVWCIMYGGLPLKSSLPLELCDISTIISATMFVCKSYLLYEIVYFWGIAGSLEALMTPDLGIYTFPHFVFFQFFLSHGSIIILCFFMTFVYSYRPSFKSLTKSFVVLNIYAGFIGIYDKFMGTNIMYLCDKTQSTSIMSFLGPWPWYLISLELVAIVSCFLCLIPFIIKDQMWNK